jgi:preprotein translocase subunit SecF
VATMRRAGFVFGLAIGSISSILINTPLQRGVNACTCQLL